MATAPAVAIFVVAGASFAEPSIPPPRSPPAMSKDATPQTPETKPGPAKPAEARLERITFGDLAGWEADDHLAAFQTFLKSCDAAIKAAAKPASAAAAQCKVPSGELAAACRAAQELKAPTKASAKAFF